MTPRRHPAVLAALAAAVAALHALLLAGWPRVALAPHPAATVTVQLRERAPLPAQPAAPADADTDAAPARAPRPPVPPAPAERAEPPTAPIAPAAPTAPAPSTQALPAGEAPPAPLAADPLPPAAPPVEPATDAAVPPAAPAADASPPPGARPEMPVYATVAPASLRRHYRVQRGAATGGGELRWSRDAAGWQATLHGEVGGATVLDWRSRGGFDAAGLAPERFVVRRRGRDAAAANFQRDAGLLSYSGPQATYPLAPGAQDRLSVLLQLSAIVAADPVRWRTRGERIAIFVTGARGDALPWSFGVEGEDTVDTSWGPLQALKLVREPEQRWDTRLELWLDDAQLPVRLRLSSPGGGEALEWSLVSEESPP